MRISKSLPIFLLLVTVFHGNAQDRADRQAFRDKFQEAEYFFLRGDFRESAFLYHEMLKADPANANLQFLTGASYLSIDGLKERAIPFLEEAVSSVSPGYSEGSYRERNAPREAFFALGRAYHIENRFNEALNYYDKYKNVMPLYDAAEIDYVKAQIESVKLAEQMIRDTLSISLKDAGENINVARSSFRAVLAKHDSMMVFMMEKTFYPAIMMTFKKKGYWEKPVEITSQLKAEDMCLISDLSSDGRDLYLIKQDELDKNIYISHFEKGKWLPMEKLSAPVNSEWDESHASVSADNKTLCFTSNRPGGFGGLDIYFSKRTADGSWSEPVNAGKPLNSLYSEDTPFLTGDGNTMFFSSMGHATMGGYDVFYASRLPNGNWSVPANLGFPISTSDDDLFFFPLYDGNQALYCSFHRPMPPGRIEWITFNPPEVEEMFSIDGTLLTEDNLEINSGTKVEIVDRNTGDTVAHIHPDPESGKYSATVNSGDYNIVVTSGDYHADTAKVIIRPGITPKSVSVKSSLVPEDVASGEYLVVKNVLFGFDSDDLDSESCLELEKLVQVMKAYPDLYVQVRGHTDAMGNPQYNLGLSRRRARSVVDYLVSRGISRERFISSGVGSMKNVAINRNPDGTDNPEGRRLNRQVEIKLINNHYENVKMEELKVPESLKPMRDKHYYVILGEEKAALDSFPAEVFHQQVRLFETGKGHLYGIGPFGKKTAATGFLNSAIDSGFAHSYLTDETEFTRMLASGDFNPADLDGPFTIQLMALRNESGFDMFDDPEKIQIFMGSDGFHRYVSGIYPTWKEASVMMKKYISEGFTDAFVMPLLNYTRLEGSLGSADPDFYYTIQITATRNKPEATEYQKISGVRITLEQDRFYRVSEGIYLTRREAEKALGEIREAGFGDAFIRKIGKKK